MGELLLKIALIKALTKCILFVCRSDFEEGMSMYSFMTRAVRQVRAGTWLPRQGGFAGVARKAQGGEVLPRFPRRQHGLATLSPPA